MSKPFESSKVQPFNVLGLLILSVVELLNPLNLEKVFAQANAYQGKTVKVIVGTAPGGGYDLWARLMAQHLGKQRLVQASLLQSFAEAPDRRVVGRLVAQRSHHGRMQGDLGPHARGARGPRVRRG